MRLCRTPTAGSRMAAAAPAEESARPRFRCSLCGFESHVASHGRQPHFNRSVVFLEDAYVIRNPGLGDPNRPLCLGGSCVVWCARALRPGRGMVSSPCTLRTSARDVTVTTRLEFLVSDLLRTDHFRLMPISLPAHLFRRVPMPQLRRPSRLMRRRLPWRAASGRCARRPSAASSTRSGSAPTA